MKSIIIITVAVAAGGVITVRLMRKSAVLGHRRGYALGRALGFAEGFRHGHDQAIEIARSAIDGANSLALTNEQMTGEPMSAMNYGKLVAASFDVAQERERT